MPEYCEQSDVTKRLTEAGVKNLADRNRGGTLTQDELDNCLGCAITWAGTEIDAALCDIMPTSVPRGASNDWLKMRAIDLAACRACSMAGRTPPESLQKDSERTMKLLDEVRDRSRTVPGLLYPLPYDTNRLTMQGPRVANVC